MHPNTKYRSIFSHQHISQGPLATEKELISLSGVQHLLGDPYQKYRHFLNLVESESIQGKDKAPAMFWTGYFYQQAAVHCREDIEKRQFLEKSLNAYSEALDLYDRAGEGSYYAQWQTAVLEEMLGMPWTTVQQSLLNTNRFAAYRAEAIRHIILHYRQSQEWQVAYLFSKYARQQFYGKPPLYDKWSVDIAFYNWKVLNYHISICSHLSLFDEAGSCFSELLTCTQEHPDHFSPEQIEKILDNKKAFQL